MLSEKQYYATADEVAELLRISTSTAYRIIRQLNAELKKAGYIVQAGRIPVKYLMERLHLEEE